MSLAVLSIDLEARLAKLQEGLDRAGRLAEKESARIAAAFAGTQKAIAAVGGALVGAFSVSVITQFTRATIDGMDALNDFADAVGTSVENASALEDVAVRTGTTLDTVTAAALKLNQALGDAKPGSAQEKALQAIGLSAKELRAIDPAEALLQVAKALGTYSDGGNKARLVQELFGKSVREVAPFLKDLAEQGRLNATVTTEQAKAAETFNKQLFELRKNFTDAARSLTSELVPAMSRFFKEFEAGSKAFGNPALALFNLGFLEAPGQGSAFQRLDVAREKIAALRKELEGINGSNSTFNERRASSIQAQIADLERFEKYYEALTGTGRRPANEGGGGLRSRMLPDLTGGDDKPSKRADDYLATARAIVEGEEQAARDTAEAWKYWEEIQLKNAKESADAQLEQWKQVFKFIDDEQERAIDEGRALLDAANAKATDAAKQLGMTFSSAFENAIVGGNGLRDVLRGLEQDIIRIITRQLVTEPFAKGLIKAINPYTNAEGFDFGKIFGSVGSLFSGFFAEGGFIPPGRWGVAGERGPEPVFGGRTGATVVPSGGRAVNNVYVTMPAGADRRTGEQFGAHIAQQLARASSRNN